MRMALPVAWLLLVPAGLSAQARRLDVTTMVVMGEGFAAGVHDFGLRAENQKRNFAAHLARQMGTILPQPLMQGPGIAVIPGFETLPAILPNTRQTVVREGFPPSLFVFNLSTPGMKLADAISRRPAEPMVRTADPQQTLVNLILGYPSLVLGSDKPLWSQLEYAEHMMPTLAIVCLGYYEAADAAASGDPARVPDAAAFRNNLNTVLSRLKAIPAEVVVANVPDPFDTAYFTPSDAVTRYVGASPAVIARLYGIGTSDWITPGGLMAVGNQLLRNEPGQLPAGSVVRAAAAEQVRERIRLLNAEVAAAARSGGAALYDLNALFRQVRVNGVAVGSRVLTADYLGGFYSLSGFYPGLVGHALIANDLLGLINRTWGENFPTVDIATVAAGDPALRRIQPSGKRDAISGAGL